MPPSHDFSNFDEDEICHFSLTLFSLVFSYLLQQQVKGWGRSQGVVLDKAFRLDKEWVSKMSPSGVEEKSKEPESVCLPPRSSLEVKPRKHVEVGVSTDPIQRGLLKKLAYVKNKFKNEDHLLWDQGRKEEESLRNVSLKFGEVSWSE